MNYQNIRSRIMKNPTLFNIVRFFFTPIRVIREFRARRLMAKEFIKEYKNISVSNKKIYYFGIPEHNNLGDIAQTYCTRRWIHDNFPNYTVLEAKTRVTFDRLFIRFIQNTINDEDIILFQSGYCTRHKNPDHLMHVHLAKLFYDYKMVILPQTVKLDNKRDIENTKKVFESCKKLKFITRDRTSYEKALMFAKKSNLDCYPDIVTSLIGREKINSLRNGMLLCIRNDSEKYYTDEELKKLRNKLAMIYSVVDVTDTNSTKDANEVYKNLEVEIREKIKQFSYYECVITDRYHGTIFSLIANTPVIVIKTNDHKVTSAIEWFNGVYDKNAIQFAKNLDEAYEMAYRIRSTKACINNGPVLFERYYKDALREMIESL